MSNEKFKLTGVVAIAGSLNARKCRKGLKLTLPDVGVFSMVLEWICFLSVDH